MPATTSPLIVTALLGSDDFAWADGLRRAHFPPERNFISAHISLFHHLPPARLQELQRLTGQLTRAAPPPAARVSNVMFLGRGVAFRVEAPALLGVRAEIADRFVHDLIPQDRAEPRLHITVQNKVEPAVAKVLHAELSSTFRARALHITGLAIWAYLGGPWQLLSEHHFCGRKA